MSIENNNTHARCVVLVPLERIDAANAVIEKFSLQASTEHAPSLAMAEICLHQQHLQTNKAWITEQKSPHLVLVHAQELEGLADMIHAVRKFLPTVKITELRDGRLEEIENQRAVVDNLGEMPIVHAEQVDADELSMLLDNKTQEVDE
jgi:putative protein kinase ArgK-like GTPase of G3E family